MGKEPNSNDRSWLSADVLPVVILLICVCVSLVAYHWMSDQIMLRLTDGDSVSLSCGDDFVPSAVTLTVAGYEVPADITVNMPEMQAAGTYIVEYRADFLGLTVAQKQMVFVAEKQIPELTLFGDEEITISQGGNYEEPGYMAIDPAEGDITVRVTVQGEYDVNTVGTYVLTYAVSDCCGNTVTAQRKLYIVPASTEPIFAETTPTDGIQTDDTDCTQGTLQNDPNHPGDKVIYLTFDDGPGAYTEQLLAVLRKYNVQVTFFVVGTGRLDKLQEIVKDGHTIGLHANSHIYSKIYADEDAYFADLYALQKKVKACCGIESWILRFPGGSSNTVSRKYSTGIMSLLTQSVQKAGFTYFDWNVDSDDAGNAKTPDEVFCNVISGVKSRDIAVVLQHDIKQYSVQAVEAIIVWGLEHGYTFLPLTQNSSILHHHINN